MRQRRLHHLQWETDCVARVTAHRPQKKVATQRNSTEQGRSAECIWCFVRMPHLFGVQQVMLNAKREVCTGETAEAIKNQVKESENLEKGDG